MDDMEILLYVQQHDAEVSQGELIATIRKEEAINLQELMDRVDNDFAGRLIKLSERGLLLRRYTSGAYKYSVTEAGGELISKELG